MGAFIQKSLIILGALYLVGHILILPVSFPRLWPSILMPAMPITALAWVTAHFVKPYKIGFKSWFKIVLSLFAIAGLIKTALNFYVGLQTRVLPFGLDIGLFAYVKKLIGPIMTLTQGLIIAAIIFAIWLVRPSNSHGDANV